MLVLFLIVLPFGHGFLLDNSQGNGGQSLPANQYLTISKFVEEKTLLQQKIDTDTTTLRHDMDTALVLLTAQLQQKFNLMEVAQNNSKQEWIILQQKYQALEQTYLNLKNENVKLQGKLSAVETELVFLRNKTNINSNDLVAMTAHPLVAKTTSGIIKFDNVEFSTGINNLSAYKRTGNFTCETGGMYLISASILSSTNGANYNILLNGKAISQTYIIQSSSPPSTIYYTGTVMVAQQLRPNDVLWVYQQGNFHIYGGLLSTFTIVKVA